MGFWGFGVLGLGFRVLAGFRVWGLWARDLGDRGPLTIYTSSYGSDHGSICFHTGSTGLTKGFCKGFLAFLNSACSEGFTANLGKRIFGALKH